MAVTEELVLKISLQNEKTAAEISKITDELKTLQKQSARTADGVNDFTARFSKFSIAATGAIRGIQFAISTIENLTGSFFEASDAITKLNRTLEIAGSKNIQVLSQHFQDLGDSIENMGIASTEQVLSLAKLGVGAGHTTEQIDKLVRASADLASFREVPIETSFKALSSTLKGSAGALAMLMPELANMTAEQAKAGLAIDYVTKLIGGTAAKNLDTFAGKIALVKTKFGDIGEEIGRIISDIFNLNDAISSAITYLDNWKQIIIENRDIFVSFGRVVLEIFNRIANGLADSTLFIIGIFSVLKEGIGRVIQAFGFFNTAIEKVLKIETGLGESISQFGKEMAEAAGNTRRAAFDTLNFSDSVKNTSKSLSENTNAISNNAAELEKIRIQLDKAKEGEKAWESLKTKLEEYTKSLSISGLEGERLIRAKAKADSDELDLLYEKIKATGSVTDAQKKAYETSKRLVDEGAQAELDKLHKDSLDKILQKNNEIYDAIKSVNATRREQIDIELKSQLELLDIEKQKLDLQDMGSKKVAAALEAQKKLLEEQAKIKKESGPSERFEGIAKAGTDAAKAISGIFTNGILDMVGGVASAVGSITQAISAAVDFIPNIINSIADVINKITDFPKILTNAFRNVWSSAIRFVKEFVPELFKGVLNILKDASAFITGIIDAFKQLLTDFPRMLFDFLDQLPTVIEDLISNIISATPEIISSIVTFLIENGPKIFVRIMKAIIIDIPKAIINGIIQGIVKIAKVIQNFFSGKGLLKDIKIDTSGIKDASKKLSDNAGRLFSVEDLTKSAKGVVQEITDKIDNAFKKGRDFVMEAWKWVLEKVLNPIWDLVTGAWRWVWDSVLSPFLDMVTLVFKGIADFLTVTFNLIWDTAKLVFSTIVAAFETIWNLAKEIFDSIVNLLKSAIEASFQIVRDLWNSLKNVVSEAFQFVKDLWDSLKNIVGTAFQFVKDLWDSLKNIVGTAFQFVKDLWDSLINVVKAAFESPQKLWDSLKNTVAIAFKFVQDIWDDLSTVVGNAFQSIKDIWNNLSTVVGNAFQSVKDIWDGLKGVVSKAFEPISQLGEKIASPIRDVLGNIRDAIIGAWGWANDVIIQPFWDTFKNLFGWVDGIFKGLKDVISKAFEPIIDLFDQIKKVTGGTKIGGTLGAATESAKKFLNNLSHGGTVYAADGVFRPIGTDTVPAMLTPGEFVVSRPAVQSIGVDNLRALNSGQTLGNIVNNISIDIKIDAKTTMDEGWIRATLVPRMSEELRRASLDGKFVLSAKGIR